LGCLAGAVFRVSTQRAYTATKRCGNANIRGLFTKIYAALVIRLRRKPVATRSAITPYFDLPADGTYEK
jgi:hypothetical protein